MKLEGFVSSGPIVLDSVIFALQKAGGISRFWSELLAGLDEKLPSRKIYALVPPNENIEWAAIRKKLKHIIVLERKKFKWGKRSLFWESLYLRSIASKIGASTWHTSYYIGFPFGFKGGKIASFYDMIHERMGKAPSLESSRKKETFEKSTKIIAISHHSKKDLAYFWPPLAFKAEVIPLCYSGAPPTALDDSSSYFLFLGNRRWYKNFLSPVHSILNDSRFADKKIIAVGGEHNLNEEERALQAQFGQRIEFRGTLAPSELATLTSGASCILYPSLYEGFGLPLLEAFAHRIPILATRSSSIVEVAGEEYPLIDNPQTVGDVLERLLREKQQWVEYGKKRLAFFSKEKMIDAFLSLYEKS